MIVLQELREDEEVFWIEILVSESQLLERIVFDRIEWHWPSIDANHFYIVLKDEFGQILEWEFIHLGVFELDYLR